MSGKLLGTTARQLRIVDAIREARRRHPDYGPTVRELAAMVGTTTNDIVGKLARLERHGIIKREQRIARSIRLVEDLQ